MVQRIFWVKRILGCKTFRSKYSGFKKFWVKTKFGQNNIWKYLDQQNFWNKKFLGEKIVGWKNFGKKDQGSKGSGTEYFVVEKIGRVTIFYFLFKWELVILSTFEYHLCTFTKLAKTFFWSPLISMKGEHWIWN